VPYFGDHDETGVDVSYFDELPMESKVETTTSTTSNSIGSGSTSSSGGGSSSMIKSFDHNKILSPLVNKYIYI
jgi:hypothetical protein